jgi:5-enolpyruvylshikimate-3-phosphate synthase
MAATVAGLVAEGTTTITQGDCHIISYPRFVDDLRALGADVGGTS